MPRFVRRRSLITGLAALAMVVAGTSCGGEGSKAGNAGSGAGGTRLWVQRYDSGGGLPDFAGGVASSPDGSKVFVSGSTATVAYRADTGRRLWVAPSTAFRRTGGSSPPPTVAVAPDGKSVFVAAGSTAIAYSADDGSPQWMNRFGPVGGMGDARSTAVSPDGTTLYVHGLARTPRGSDLLTSAYSVSDGRTTWSSRYDGPGGGDEMLFPRGSESLAVDPAGKAVFVTGGSQGKGSGADYATVAYRSGTGAVLWVSRYDGPAHGDDAAQAVSVSPDGSRAFTTGSSNGGKTNSDVATVGYAAGTGKQVWASRYDGPAGQNEGAGSIAVSPDGSRVFLTGTSEGPKVGLEDFVTIGYDTGSGEQVWAKRYDGQSGGDDNAAALGIDPQGDRVYVAGWSKNGPGTSEFATVAYRASSGEQVWTQRYHGPGNRQDQAVALAVSPRGGRVFVTGSSADDYATLAYRE